MGICIRWLLTYGSATVHHSLRLSACPDEGRTVHVAILSSALSSHPPAVLYIHVAVQHPANAVGTNRRRDIHEGLVADIAELPDTCRTPVVHVSLDKPLLVYSRYIPLAEKGHGKRRTFFHRAVRVVNLYAISQPLVR